MSVASMVVGQYYMTQINEELGAIIYCISIISYFQYNEYRIRFFSLVAHVKKIADFQTEILENDELRLSKIAQLDSLEEECTRSFCIFKSVSIGKMQPLFLSVILPTLGLLCVLSGNLLTGRTESPK